MSEEIILRSRSPPYEIPLISVGQYLIQKLQKIEDNTCLIEMKTGKELTVKQLITQAHSIAVSLIKRGITKSDIILCFSANNLEYAVLLFAIYFLGNTFTPVNPTNGVFELKNQIKDSGSTFIFTSLSNAHIVDKILNDHNNSYLREQIKSVFVFNGTHNDFLPFSQLLSEGNNQMLQRIPFFEVNPKEDLFTIIYTSGTTGLPKGAMHTHYNIIAALEGFNIWDVSRVSFLKLAGIYPFGHASGTVTLPVWVSQGHTLVIYESLDEEVILQSVEKYKINTLVLFPAFGHRLLDGDLKDKYDLSSLKFMTTGGSKFPENVAKGLIKKYNIKFSEGYGMTEYLGPLDSFSDDEFISGCVGRVSALTQIKIIDLNTGKSLGPNLDGEICLKGPKLFVGYLNNESATKDSFDSNGWFHTGDVGHYDEKERFFITDRLKELIKFKAWSVAPAEIESLLLTHESVESVAVVGVKHKTDGQLPRAFVKVKNNSKVTEEELVKFVEDNMAFQKRLRAGVRFVDKIPRTIIGKIERQFFKNLVSNEIIG